jgi:tetratricopeptide (TPR) repeat protein
VEEFSVCGTARVAMEALGAEAVLIRARRLDALGDLEPARDAYEDALRRACAGAGLSPSHVRGHLARLLERLGERAAAAATQDLIRSDLELALEDAERGLASVPGDTDLGERVRSLVTLGRVQSARGSFEAALAAFDEAGSIASNLYGLQAPELARLADDVATTLLLLGDRPRAERWIAYARAMADLQGVQYDLPDSAATLLTRE